MINQTYVLMTAAHNEEATLENTIESVLSQTTLPTRWVIVSDSSVDNTDRIIQKYESSYPWIKYLRIDREAGRSFASKVIALRQAESLLKSEKVDLIGNIDADVTLERNYFRSLIDRLGADPALGIAGGFVYEESKGAYCSRPLNSEQSVPHAAQLVRRTCYDSIGGYALLKYGGEDWHALVSARMNGWTAAAFPDLKIFHHRPNTASGTLLRNSLRAGRMDYSFGSYPPFEILKCIRRLRNGQFPGGAVRMCGFIWGYVRAEKRPVSDEFIAFLRSEQRDRVVAFLKGRVRLNNESVEA
jgi:glycosyltransferase involved in cell wall biosynthesis